MFLKKVAAKYIIADKEKEEDEDTPTPSGEALRFEALLRHAARKAGAEAGDSMRGVFTPMTAGERRKKTMSDFNVFLKNPNIGVDLRPSEKPLLDSTKMRITHSLAKEFADAFQKAYGYDEDYYQ